jgi:hypothetical protein
MSETGRRDETMNENAGHEHTWICLVPKQGPSAKYGCQNCPATAVGRDLGVTR